MVLPDVDASIFRQLCGRFATGVVVITLTGDDGKPLGMTANSFASVSLAPPLVSVNIDHGADMHRHLLRAERFAINVLESRQEAVSRRFAAEHASRFTGVGFHVNPRGLPILDGIIAVIECERHATLEAGDHTIVVGRVTGGEAREGQPLLYYRGGYYDLAPG